MKKIIASMAGLALVAASCTGDFKEINRQLNGLDETIGIDYTVIGVGLIPLQQVVLFNTAGWDYQLYQNLNADMWSGYTSTCSFFASNASNQNYVMNAGWNVFEWDKTYEHVMPKQWQNYLSAMRYGYESELTTEEQIAAADWKKGKYSHFVAVNTILRVMAMARLTDQYGPIIYSKWGKGSGAETAYDNMPDLYKTFFAELKDVVKFLDDKIKADGTPMGKNMATFDMVYKGDLSKWARLANTIRLRLAMRMVKADPTLAKTEAEAAMAETSGLMVESADSYVLQGNNWKNPFFTISVGWGDCLASADMESIMGGYKDPRLPKYIAPAPNGKYTGARLGLPNKDNKDTEIKAGVYAPYISKLNVPSLDAPTMVMSNAEAFFLKAEAALRGWSVGTEAKTAKELYEAGITASFAYHGVELGSYLSSTNLPTGWTDPLPNHIPENDIAEGASKVYPKWEDSDSNEVKLEKIITQKWIAGFPEGMNAWAEYRRTGYPKLFPVAENKSGGAISTELGPRRLAYAASEYQMNPNGVAAAVKMLGGADNCATRLWWDKDAPNF